MPFPQLTPPDRRVAAGVCGGIADAIGVDATLVRLVFALLALAGGAGIVLYVAAWFAMSPRRRDKPWAPLLLVVIAASLALGALGLSGYAVASLALIAGGLTLIWRRGGSLRPGAPLSAAGLVLVAAGFELLLARGGPSDSFLAPGAVGGALLLVAGPWLWQLGLERDAERTARIRTEERAEVAARVHDSVLQTLALIQRHAEEPRRVASLARRPTWRSCTAYGSSSRARATAPSTSACGRSCSRRARRWRTRRSSRGRTRSRCTQRSTARMRASSSATGERGSIRRPSQPTAMGSTSRFAAGWPAPAARRRS